MTYIEVNTRKAGTYIEAFKHVNADIIIGTKDLIAENRPKIRRMVSFCKRMMTKMPVRFYYRMTHH